jgi:branched-subunit amino acid aminotransferase/4-amino-4-deoxychorismate lyase
LTRSRMAPQIPPQNIPLPPPCPNRQRPATRRANPQGSTPLHRRRALARLLHRISTPSPPHLPVRAPGLRLLASKSDSTRAWPGGFGYAKVGANYGPSFVAHGEAQERGYDRILWLLNNFALNDLQVTETGASNFFIVMRTKERGLELVTAPLEDKVILAGITR